MDVLLLRAFASTRMCLPSHCLAVGMHITICSSVVGPTITKEYILLIYTKENKNKIMLQQQGHAVI
jgi:hypothetical protein